MFGRNLNQSSTRSQLAPNHKCQNCGREFYNRPGDNGGNSICYKCGDEAPHGIDAGFDPADDPYHYSNREGYDGDY